MHKDFFIKKINTYFVLMTIALTVSAFLWLFSANSGYVSRVDILLSPKNTKTSIYLNSIKENLVQVFNNNINSDEEVVISGKKEGTIITLKVSDENKNLALDLSQESLIKFLSIAGRYYDIKNDLEVKVVGRSVVEVNGNIWTILFFSSLMGLFFAFIIQVLLNIIENFPGKKNKVLEGETAEKLKKDLKDILNLNKEKIEKLSKNYNHFEDNNIFKGVESEKEKKHKDVSGEIFKKASSPSNLPIAEFDDEILKENEILKSEEEIKKTMKEPSDDEYKKRLNQLLGE